MTQKNLFPNLSDPSIYEIFGGDRAWERLSFKKGDVLIKEGEVSEEFYYLCEGQVAVEKGKALLAHLQAGDFFGEGALLSRESRGASVTALTDGQVLKLSRSTFEDLLQNDSSASLSLLLGLTKVLNMRLQRSNERLIVLYEIAAMMAKGKMDLQALLEQIFEKLQKLGFGSDLALFTREGELVYVGSACSEKILDDLRSGAPHYAGQLRSLCGEPSIVSDQFAYFALPGVHEGALGILAMGTKAMLSEDEIRFLVVLSHQLGQVISLFHEKDLSS